MPNLSDLATKKIRELVEISTLGGYIPLDSASFGTKKFDASKLALKTYVDSEVSRAEGKANQNATDILTLRSRVVAVENKVAGALCYIGEETVAGIMALPTTGDNKVANGSVYSLSNSGTITYTFNGSQKNLPVEEYDEIAWSDTKGWNILGKDRRTDLSEYSKTSAFANVAFSGSYNDLEGTPNLDLKANKSEMSITDVSGDSRKKTIQLKSGLSQDVLVAHQDISGKANTADVEQALALKANASDVEQALALKANASDVETALSGKANASEMSITAATRDAGSDKKIIQLKSGVSTTVVTDHQDISGKANNSDLSFSNGTSEDKVKIKLGDSKEQEVLKTHQNVTGKANKDEMSIEAVQGDSTKKTIQLKSGLSQEVLVAHQDISGKANDADLAAVAKSGSYNDLSNQPPIPKGYTTIRTVSPTIANNVATYTVNPGEYAILQKPQNVSANLGIKIVADITNLANDQLLECGFELNIDGIGVYLTFTFFKGSNAVSDVVNLPSDLTLTDKLFGVFANDAVFIGETIEST